LTSRALLATPPTCAAGYVNCVKGKVNDGNGNPTTTHCTTACGGNCCVGYYACKDFTGQVCKDGSCGGLETCYAATIPFVVNSCKEEYACRRAGTVGNMVSSCTKLRSCQGLGRQGTAGDIQNSCTAIKSCFYAGYEGTVGNMVNSCTADQSCYKAGSGSVGAITSDLNGCCNTDKSCSSVSEATLPSECRVREMQCLYIILLAPFLISNLLIINISQK
jgi:hypothetical protein